MIVSEVPGTTRDSVDVRFERDGKAFIAIDTAGVRRQKSIASDIEFYGLARAQRSIRRADVVLLFLDGSQRISKVDKQLADYILEQYKPAIFVVNKWDLLRPLPTGEFANYLRRIFPNLDFVPIAFTTAKSGKNVYRVLSLARNIQKQASRRIPTAELNRVLRQALEQQPPPMRQNRRPKIAYATQVATNPPTILLFTNGPELFDATYQRYLLKTFRDQLGFTDVPIKLYLRHKHREEAGPDGDEEQPAKQRPDRTKRRAAEPPGKKDRKQDRRRHAPELWKDL
jgi:GTP-binding protein